MKKLSLFVFVFAVIFFLASGSVFSFTNEASIDITVTIFNAETLSITNAGQSILSFGSILMGTTNYLGTEMNDRAIFENNGSAIIDIELKAESSGLSIVGTLTGGNDEALLSGVFIHYTTNIGPQHFQSDDVITTTYQACTTTKFAEDGNSDEGSKGYNVNTNPATSQRSLKFSIVASQATLEDQKTITVYAKAVSP